MRALGALIGHELQTMARARHAWLGGGMLLASYAAAPLQPTTLPDPTAPPPPTTCPADPPDVAVVGDWPPDLAWPEPFVEGAAVTLTAWLDDGVVVITTTPPDSAVRACLRDAVRVTRSSRLASLGLAGDPDALVSWTNAAPPAPPPPRPPVSWPGVWLGAGAVMWIGSAAMEMIPRRRQTGLLGQLRSTSTGEGTLVAAWVAATTAWGLLHLTLAAGVLAVSGALAGASWGWGGALHVPALGLLTAAASTRTSLLASDTQAATLRWFAVTFAAMAGGGLAFVALDHHPALAALVPFGGSLLAVAGWLGPWAWLADLASLATAGTVLAASASVLRGEDDAAAGADATLARRAAGRWGPEVLVLTAFGLASNAISGGVAFAERPLLGLAIAFGTAMLLPALLAPVATGVPRAELLPLRAPRASELLLAVGLVPALIPVAVGLLWLASTLLPLPEALERLARTIGELASSPAGALALALLPAICEEALYRGAIQGLLVRGGAPWRANVVQAAAFAVAHVLPARLPGTFVMGVVLGGLRQRTGSLVPGMVLHFLFNGTMVLLPQHLEGFGGG